MHPRNNLVEIFSTFLVFADDRFCRWVTDAKLRRSIANAIQQTPQETDEDFWISFLYNQLRKSSSVTLAKEHTIAYLQEPCYWTSQKIVASFATTQYKLSDCFQIAITQVDKIFKGFNPNSGSSLKNYASTVFGLAIRETFRQRHEIDICTDWGLLRKISKKRLEESLQAESFPRDTIVAYMTVWNCFKLLYVPTQAHTSRQLSKPDNQTWEAIAKAYNSQTHQQVHPQTLETWLLASAKAVRRYLYPNVTSFNAPVNSEDSGEWLDNIPSNELDSPLTYIIAQEEQQLRGSRQSEINQVLIEALTQLDPQARQILQLYYTQGLTQQQIAKQLQVQQYTVSRRLTKTRETLLKSLASWSQENLHISMTPDILKSTSAVMEEWLQVYYMQDKNQKVL
ncbi:group 3/4 sigma-70 RNA polymerase sigma factor [Scytonema hofmannii PCC 7110]|uniref:Group 3/4 sigma-70 RNA polymerase sigma factor n=1 Tax=Scytonema hofmannii PCC 7110 TaxID=128403 RepID=A0A139X5L1_9CYAN|nr:sigma-70 family RNA polymerase sigma factor [Scytonema hofmannii]KYC40001.1 group 3/4 sigma-70 RNA polymerase sigma factor [Scytonema hofmannii PCC 7110]